MIRGDTIAAISSSVGPAARMILRLSGPGAAEVAATVGVPVNLQGSTASRISLAFDGFTFPAWVYVFQAPRSYTGDDLIELHIPGNPLLAARLLDHLLKHGARAAEPGEFTARAFLNGRMDLSSAEGVAAVIGAGNENELQAGRRLMAGELARRLTPILQVLKQTLALVEVGIDFSQEDVTILAADEQTSRIAEVDVMLQSLLADSSRFGRMSHEPRVVLVGRPNAGKSTLLNVLAGHERAIVSPVAGTTRDALSARVALPRGYILLTDVAGVEETPSADAIDQQMQSQAQRALAEADVVLILQDVTDLRPRLTLARTPHLFVRTKIDLTPPGLSSPAPGIPGEGWGGGSSSAQGTQKDNPLPNPPPEYRGREPEETSRDLLLSISAKSGTGMSEFITALDTRCFGDSTTSSGLALNVRHVRAIGAARSALVRTAEVNDAELIAADLREALDALGSVLGEVSPDDILGEIFSGFCIGK